MGLTLYNYLKNDTAVSLAVAGEIYPVVAPSDKKIPFIVYQNIVSVDETSLQGDKYNEKTRFQIKIYSHSYGEVKEVLGVVKEALYSFGHFPHDLTIQDLYEKETKLFGQLIDFKFNN